MQSAPTSYRLLIWVLFIAFTLRFSLSFLHPFSADEAHYALYALHLDLSYFDHPPLTGWLYALMLSISESEWFVRLLPNVFNILTAVGLFHLSKHCFPGQTKVAIGSVLLYESSLLLNVLSLGFIPETPLVALGVWASICLVRITQNPNLWHAWLKLGILLGLMGLTKYTAVLYAVGAGLYLSLQKIQWWKSAPFYTALALAILIISPVMIWNLENDFLSFLYQWDHGKVSDSGIQTLPLLIHQATQLVTYTPLIFLGSWALSLTGVWKSGYRLIACLNLVFLGVFAYSSSKGGHYLPHWTALPMTLAIPFIVQWCSHKRWRQWLFKANLVLNGMLCLAMAALLAGYFPKALNQLALADFNGWKTASAKALSHAKQLPEQHQQLFVDNRWVASRFGWYAKPLPIIPLDQRFSQFSLWHGSPVVGSSGILALNTDLPLERRFNKEALFRKCTLLEKVHLDTFRGERTFDLFYCQQLLPSDQY